MNWNPKTWKFNWKNDKERWMLLLAAGLILLILAFPGGKQDTGKLIRSEQRPGINETETSGTETAEFAGGGQPDTDPSAKGADSLQDAETVSAHAASTYEQQLEQRLKAMLSQVEGVGAVDVMVVLKSSEEKVWHVDQDSSYSRTQENDSSGGSRSVENQDISRVTVITGRYGGSGDSQEGEGPLLEKEIRPEISGVVVAAEGGGSPQIQAEISAAVEALFNLPAHRIKILRMKK